MEDRVKERLTGAAILVALVVLVVPEMFGGRAAPVAVSAATRASEDAAPLRSYTIELDPARGSALPGTVALSAAVRIDTPSPPPATAIEPVAPPPALSVAPPTPASARNAGGWVVQLGSFSRRENAEKMVQSAAGKGITLAIAGPDARGLYRVRTEPLADRQRAAALQTQLKAQGYVGVINASQ